MNRVGFQTLLAKETRRFFRVPGQTLAQPVVTTSLYFLVFGYALGGRWDGSKYELRFPAVGSVLTFAHAKNRQEAASLSSAEINLLLLDERTTMPPDVVDFLYTRIRSGVVGVPCLGARSASNPGPGIRNEASPRSAGTQVATAGDRSEGGVGTEATTKLSARPR